MYPQLINTINKLDRTRTDNEERAHLLMPLIEFIQDQVNAGLPVILNFICTHNSRRSHLCQVWAQAAAAYFNITNVYCYSGGTETTALFPVVAETLSGQGFNINMIAAGNNPIYAIKYDENAAPVIGFSKSYAHPFNPVAGFAAIMTCSQADSGCPFIPGAAKRIPVTFEDPGRSDGTGEQAKVYAARSLEIAAAMFYVFSRIEK